MDLSYEATAAFAKSFGLIYLMVIFLGVVVYAFWPSLGGRFDRAAKSVLNDEEGPVRPPDDPETEAKAEPRTGAETQDGSRNGPGGDKSWR